MARTPNPERSGGGAGRGGQRGPGDRPERGRGQRSDGPPRGADREESEMVDKLVHINRVAKVVKGGRRFAFAALVVVGDTKGKGIKYATETILRKEGKKK